MIIRLKNGKLLEIKKSNFVTDKQYYKYIYNLLS